MNIGRRVSQTLALRLGSGHMGAMGRISVAMIVQPLLGDQLAAG